MNPPPQSPSASEFPTNAGNIGQCSAGWAGHGSAEITFNLGNWCSEVECGHSRRPGVRLLSDDGAVKCRM